MKKRIYTKLIPCCKFLVIVLLGILFASSVKAQVIAFYPLTSSKAITGNTPSGQAWAAKTNANVTTGTATVGSEITANGNTPPGSYHSQGIEMKTAGDAASEVWPSAPDPRFTLGLPLSPKTGFDIHLTNISFTTDSAGESEYDPTTDIVSIQPFYQVDGAGPWVPLANAQTVSNSTPASTILNYPVNNAFYSGHTYVVAFFFTTPNGATKEDEIYMDNIIFQGTTSSPPAGPITVTTGTPTATGKYTATAPGSYSFGNQYYLATQSGIVYSTSSTNLTTALSTVTTDGANGVINDNLTGLSANTKYYVKAYAVTQFSTQYGALDSFMTAPFSLPAVTINLTSILSNKAGVTGTITDSGGEVITEKGFIWTTTGVAPTLTSNTGKQYEGFGTQSFPDFVKGLKPNTPYCVSAYAINAVGAGISHDTCFITAVPQPVLTAIPGAIDFGGTNYFNNPPLILSYTLSGSDFTTPTGNIAVNAPSGFLIALSPAGPFAATINVPYTNSSLNSTPIYVEMTTGAYGTFSGNITETGGGVSAANADMVALTGSVVQSPIDVSNTGTDFWTGFGYENKMTEESSSTSKPYMTVYVAAGSQAANVTVELPGVPGGGYPQSFTIPAGSTHAFVNFPDGATANSDSRLYYTGISNRGIHIFSTNGAPISAWIYIATTGNSAGGALLFPTNTWNSNYTVQAYADNSNNGLPNSFFFVIADQDNTPVTITPSTNLTDSSQALMDNPSIVKYPKGVPFTITLNKGQVFNGMGFTTGTGNNATSLGFDLSGTAVSTTCDKKIAVFGGNGRSLVTTPVQCTDATAQAGSDNMIQQMIPSVAWDTKYFTVPTKTMEHNLFRIYVKSVTTQVWINDTSHGAASKLSTGGGIVNGSTFNGDYTFTAFTTAPGGYYSLETSNPLDIESDLPISVTQFITAGDCAINPTITGNNGSGDPEMIILTGAQQAITNATVYSPTFQNGKSGGGYINIVIPQAGVSSFKLDNAAMVDTGSSSYTGTAYAAAALIPIAKAFQPYPKNPNYYWAKFHVSYPASHTMSSAVPFNGIAYGVASGESYGFNAGTQVKNLSSVQFTNNPNGGDSSATAVRTCVGNSVTLKLALPYNPFLVDSLVWNPQGDPRITPNTSMKGAITAGHAKYDDSIQVDGRTFYVYSSPVSYTFSQIGTYRFPITAYGTFASDCPGEDIENMVIIVGSDQANLTYLSNCGNPTVVFNSDTIPMAGTNIVKTIFDFGDGKTSINGSLDTPHTYSATQIYTAKLTTYNSVGCISTDSIQVDFSGGLKANYTTSANAICTGGSITFTDNSTVTGASTGTPNKWVWNFGDGTNEDSTGSTVSHLYTLAGKHVVSLTVRTTAGCVDIFIDSVTIEATPIAAFAAGDTCLGNPTVFINQSTVPNNLGTVDSVFYDFGDGTTLDSLAGSTTEHVYASPGPYTVKLYVKSDGGCLSPTVSHSVSIDSLPTTGFISQTNCATKTVMFTDTSNAHGGIITEWDWNFGDGSPDSIIQKPTGSATPISFVHGYPTATSGQSFTVTLSVKTKNSCTDPKGVFSSKVSFGASPVTAFTLPTGSLCLPNASAAFTNTTTISDGSADSITYIWNFGDASATAIDTLKPKNPVNPVQTLYTYNTVPPAAGYTVTLTAISDQGCSVSTSQQLTTIYAQPVAAITTSGIDCLNDSLSFSGNSDAAAWNWSFGDGTGTDFRQAPNYEWKAPGKYGVSLTVTSIQGCKSVPVVDSIIVDSLPTAKFVFSKVDCSTDLVTIQDSSTGNGGTIAEWYWNLGDGTDTVTKNNNQFTHLYANGNGQTYTVTLTVKTKDSCTNTSPPQSFAIGASPVPQFSVAPGLLCLPNAVATFVNTSSISDGTTNDMSYIWNFGDSPNDSPVVKGTPSPATAHIYTTTGPYTITLTAISDKGCTSSTSLQLNTINPLPIAVITPASIPATCLNDSASLSGNSINTTSQWAWDFGDNSGTSTLQAPKYEWKTPGKYGVSLIITATTGCKSAPAIDSIIVNPLPIADFTIAQPSLCAKNSIAFTNASSANVNTWAWDFGDNTSSSQSSPSHTYSTDGTYTVGLKVTDINGCSNLPWDTSIVVNPLPQPGFTIPVICVSAGASTFTATNAGTATGVTWQWNFDGNIIPGSPATYNYPNGGPDSVKLIGTSDKMCIDSVTLADTAYNIPTAKDSIVNSSSLCSNMPVTLINESSVEGNGYGSISKIEIYWDYTNKPTPDIIDNSPQPNRGYTNQYPALPTDNTYTVQINAFSGNGCPSAPSPPTLITVHGSPTAQFAPLAPVCQEAAAFALTSGSEVIGPLGSGRYTGNGVSGDSLFSPQQAGPGTSTLTYTYTANGCFDTAMQTITVYPTPAIDYGGVQSILEGDSATLSQVSATGIALQYLWSPAAFLNTDTSATPVCKPVDDITYTITATSPGGCHANASLLVQVLKDFVVPNTFTPNNDGINDTWVIEELPKYPIQWVQVFDRYGQLLYESHGYSTPWDGTYKGHPLAAGTYYYIIELNGLIAPKTGYVTILR